MVVNKKEKFFADLDEISGWKLIKGLLQSEWVILEHF